MRVFGETSRLGWGNRKQKAPALNKTPVILQIVPRLPGSLDGVGDYASILSDELRADFNIETKFVAPPFASPIPNDAAGWSGIVFHYVNYGYHNRGVPIGLPSTLRQLKQAAAGRFLTIFHELYASGPPWRSAFWLQPTQKSIARAIARLSDICIVSSETMRDLLRKLSPASKIAVHPVISTIGEPVLDATSFVRRNPQRWGIFGGTHLLERSLSSFQHHRRFIPDAFSPRELFVIGGVENNQVRDALARIGDIKSHYHPSADRTLASEILSTCSFGWLDYFQQADVPADAILKSTSFSSYCAHGVIPVFPEAISAIAIENDPMPGPFFIREGHVSLPLPAERAKVASQIDAWYRRHGSAKNLARGIAAALQLEDA
jgi:hypothetical protein